MISNTSIPLEQQFTELHAIISLHRVQASRAVNDQYLLTAWHVGAYISHKLKTQEWGGKVVAQFAEYMRTHAPDMRGFSRRNIYNMVMFYDQYSSALFLDTIKKFMPTFVQSETSQIEDVAYSEIERDGVIVQSSTAQLSQPLQEGMPDILKLTSFTNHVTILNYCKTSEERLFYILYSNRERLNAKELQRSISNNTYASLLGSKHNLSKGLIDTYPQSPVLFKDTAYVDFLGLPKTHSEKQLRNGLVEHMKQFILELGKDFLFVDQEYKLEVGSTTFKADLLFFHRGLQALVAVELKSRKFHPKDMGQLEFYLEALDRDVKRSNENPSIGILLCTEADRTVVEYAMSRSMSPTMVAEYKRQLIPKEKMQQLLHEYCDLVQLDKKE